MKTLLIIASFLAFQQTETKVPELYGVWILEKIVYNQEVLIPKKRDFKVTFSDDLISYNLDVNRCQTRDFIIIDNTIKIDRIACTKICCDGSMDSISDYINYSGVYTIQNNQLIISNTESMIYLNRVLEDLPPKPHNF
jgi:hypothetical protein